MALMREYTYNWTGYGSALKQNILYTVGEGVITDFPTAWRSMIESRKAGIGVPYQGFFSSEVRIIADNTGDLVSTENLTQDYKSVGTGTDPLPDATQGLLRFRTALIRDGRRVQGRCFIPGIVRAAVVLGNNGDRTAWNTAAAGLPLAGLVVWSRPRAATQNLPARVGVSAPVTSVDCWNEFAVLRKRRG